MFNVRGGGIPIGGGGIIEGGGGIPIMLGGIGGAGGLIFPPSSRGLIEGDPNS